MLARLIGPRGRTVLVCEALTLAALVALGFALEAVSPGWWGVTRNAFGNLFASGTISPEHGEPSIALLIEGRPKWVLPMPDRPSDGVIEDDAKKYRMTALFRLTSTPVLKATLANPKVQRIDFLREMAENERRPFLKSILHIEEQGEIVVVSFPYGKREEKAIILNALADAFTLLYIEVEQGRASRELDDTQKMRDDLQVRLDSLRKSMAKRDDGKGSSAEIDAMEQVLGRLCEQIETQRINRNAPGRIQILYRAH